MTICYTELHKQLILSESTLYLILACKNTSYVEQHDEQKLHTNALAFSIFNHHHHHYHHHTPIDANKPTLPQ